MKTKTGRFSPLDLLKPPHFEGDDDLTRQALLLNIVLINIFAGAAIYGLFIVLIDQNQFARLYWAAAVVWGALLLKALLHRGFVRLTTILFSLLVGVVVSGAAYTNGGVVSPAYNALLILILFTGLLVGPRGSYLAAVYAALYGLLLLWFEMSGRVPFPTTHNTLSWWATHSIFFFIAAVLLATATGRLRDTLTQLRRSEQKLVRANAELTANQAALENRVRERTAQLEQQLLRQAALAKIELAINQSFELHTTLNHVVDVTRDLLPSTGGASVILWNEQQGLFDVSASNVPSDTIKSKDRVRTTGGASRWIIDHGRPVVVGNINDDPFGTNRMLVDADLQAYVGVPLSDGQKTVGVLYALSLQPQAYTQDDIDFLTALANRAAVAITKIRMVERAEELAAQDERQRLARELHDVVSQTLFTASIISETLPRLLDRDQELVREHLHDLHRLTRGALAEMRILLLELRPADLQNASIKSLLEQLATGFFGRSQIPVHTKIIQTVELPFEVKIAIYRICQEALNNIIRHARASQVWMTFETNAAGMVFNIRDNGRGFNPQSIPTEHMGVRIMVERASEIGAAFNLDSQLGKGTSITLKWHYPLQEMQPGDRPAETVEE